MKAPITSASDKRHSVQADRREGRKSSGTIGRAKAVIDNPAFRRLFTNAGKLQLNRLLSAALSALQIALIARFLSPERYGIYALVLNTAQVIQSAFDVRCGELVIRYFFQYRNAGFYHKLSPTLVAGGAFEAAISLIGATLLLIFSGPFSRAFFHSSEHTELFACAALIPLFNIGSGLAAAVLTIDRSYGKLAIADSLSNVVGFVSLLCILPFHASLTTLLAVTLIAQLTKGLLRWVYLLRSDTETRRLLTSGLRAPRCIRALRADAPSIFKFAFSNNIFAFLKILQGSVPNFAIGLLCGPAQVAYYYLGQRIGTRLSALCTPITDVTFREIAEGKDATGVRHRQRALWHGMVLIAATVSPVFLGLVVLGHWTIPMIFGNAYLSGLLAIEITVATYAIALIFNPLGSLLMVQGKVWLINLSFAAGLIVQLITIAFAVSRYSSTGAALALTCFYLVANAITVLGVARIMRERPRA